MRGFIESKLTAEPNTMLLIRHPTLLTTSASVVDLADADVAGTSPCDPAHTQHEGTHAPDSSSPSGLLPTSKKQGMADGSLIPSRIHHRALKSASLSTLRFMSRTKPSLRARVIVFIVQTKRKGIMSNSQRALAPSRPTSYQAAPRKACREVGGVLPRGIRCRCFWHWQGVRSAEKVGRT